MASPFINVFVRLEEWFVEGLSSRWEISTRNARRGKISKPLGKNRSRHSGEREFIQQRIHSAAYTNGIFMETVRGKFMNNARTTFASDSDSKIVWFMQIRELRNLTLFRSLKMSLSGQRWWQDRLGNFKLGSFLARSRKSKFLNSKLVLWEIDKHAINNTELIRLEPRSLVSLGGTSPYQVLPSGRWSLRTRNLTFSFRKNPIHL